MTPRPSPLPLLQPFRFRPIMKQMIWGGQRLAPLKGLPAPEPGTYPYGEAWEICGLEGDESVVAEGPDAGLSLSQLIVKYGARLMGDAPYRRYGHRFPILVKYIDADRDLSVQVHPDDATALAMGLPCGKSEMWHVLDCAPGAEIYAGFARDITPEDYDRAVANDEVMEAVAVHRSRPGATFVLPGGTIHAIGAGNFLIEVQQTSGTTFRIYDYNRLGLDGNPRPLHTAHARRALTFAASHPECPMGPGDDTLLVEAQWGKVRRHNIAAGATRDLPFAEDSFTIISVVEGEADILVAGAPSRAASGTTLLVAAEVPLVQVRAAGSSPAALLSVTL